MSTAVEHPLGTVYLVGAGPGAPDLLTVRAARLLAAADVVFHDALVDPRTLALAARARHIPVGKRSGRHSTAQRFINKRLVDAARAHRVVVRLKGGDSLLFGRAQEEIEALHAHGVACEVVPGVTAALAAAAELRTSLTVRGSVRSVAFVTPRVGAVEAESRAWVEALRAADAGAIYMGAGEAGRLARLLIEAGKPASLPVAIVADASLPGVRTIHSTLGALAQDPALAGTASAPTILLIGPQFIPRAATSALAAPAPAAALREAGAA